ncbi:hypothetical protein E2C01_039377 [Portunus trituberculatus]|uniref:Uncharacterized protein n=1 Tax=Portunus trituberculatus TaxID=210409 RepID=A0A5B7FEL0_PORTR|nr:hypothetical protein [Portunus trituberculatus]
MYRVGENLIGSAHLLIPQSSSRFFEARQETLQWLRPEYISVYTLAATTDTGTQSTNEVINPPPRIPLLVDDWYLHPRQRWRKGYRSFYKNVPYPQGKV